MNRMVRYRLKAECVDDNLRLVEDVYRALARLQPHGLRYATFRLDDGLSFMHIASYDSEDDRKTLTGLPEFRRFLAGVAERCDEQPVTVGLQEIGSHGFFAA
jgi:hypothetical protein